MISLYQLRLAKSWILWASHNSKRNW